MMMTCTACGAQTFELNPRCCKNSKLELASIVCAQEEFIKGRISIEQLEAEINESLRMEQSKAYERLPFTSLIG